MNISQRVEALRNQMRAHDLSAYIIPSSDPHQSEYPPDRWRARQWISGFEGSAGTVVITLAEAGLWTDSRYYLEAEQALRDTPITLFRAGQALVPQYVDWLSKNVPGGRVGFDSSVLSLETARSLRRGLAGAEIEVVPSEDLLEAIWENRPPLPDSPAELVDEHIFGETRKEKLTRIRTAMGDTGADAHLIATLDDLAWALNIRGSDVPFNPVLLAYLVVEAERALLFLDPAKLAEHDRAALTADGVVLRDYDTVWSYLQSLPADTALLYDPQRVGARLDEALPDGVRRVERRNPSTDFKASKNATELDHLRACMISDGVAMTEFLYWLESRTAGAAGTAEAAAAASPPGAALTELDAARKLGEMRAARPGFVNPSFETIAGYAGHGAIVHYRVTPESNATLTPGGVLLLDSGGQYRNGTTDITRTVPIGEVDAGVRADFTLVLRAHIALAMTVFPAGTSGHQLDAIPRRPMWQHGVNYGHGTGHGVGFFLNVHEGPQRISAMPNTVALEPGMVVSIEPGLYREGRYGIRIENLVVVGEDRTTDFDHFLKFETLTLCPIERTLIDASMLTAEERAWVDSYHAMVWERVGAEVEGPVREWLRAKTLPLQ
ncbi:MAG: aminopeptidase P family protein [Spirochaetia bacterium]